MDKVPFNKKNPGKTKVRSWDSVRPMGNPGPVHSAESATSWATTQLNLERSLQGLNEQARELVGEVRSYKKELSETYELKIVDQLMELYRFLEDAYSSHSNLASSSGSHDYLDAVDQYCALQDMLLSNLQEFGVTYICSPRGAFFDGSIHEPDRDYGATCDYSRLRIAGTMHVGFESEHLERILRKEVVFLTSGELAGLPGEEIA